MPSNDSMDQVQRQQEQLRAQYGNLLDEVAAILFRHDPARINFETNTDEYEPEASTIITRLNSAHCVDDVRRIVREELKRWFGSGTGIRGSRRDAAAIEIWNLWCSHRAR